MWHDLLVAFALLLVIEGIVPFLSPDAMRRALLMAIQMSDNALRFMGLSSMLIGVLLLALVN